MVLKQIKTVTTAAPGWYSVYADREANDIVIRTTPVAVWAVIEDEDEEGMCTWVIGCSGRCEPILEPDDECSNLLGYSNKLDEDRNYFLEMAQSYFRVEKPVRP